MQVKVHYYLWVIVEQDQGELAVGAGPGGVALGVVDEIPGVRVTSKC